MPRRTDEAEAYESGRPKLTTRDALALVWATYKVSAPYLLVFVLLFLLGLWLVTEVLFR